MERDLRTLVRILTIAVTMSGLMMVGLTVFYRTRAAEPMRIREEAERRLAGPSFVWRVLLNGAFSGAIVFGITIALRRFLVTTAPVPAWRYPVEIVAVLLVYDFLYYFLHRFPFHEWGYLKRVHAVHHMARYPLATDSLYLHPVENFLGLALLLFCTWLVGPVSVWSFAVIFVVYTQLNVIIHCGLALPGPFAFLGAMATKHERHHRSMRGGNFASITPLPDILFRTRE